MKTLKRMVALWLIFAAGITLSNAQQVIGSFPAMDGGIENQNAGALGNTLSTTAWSVSTATGTATVNLTGGRSGPKTLTFGYTSTTTKRLQSPTTLTTANTQYTVQFYYKTADATAPTNMRLAIGTNGTSNNNYVSIALLGTSGIWTKAAGQVTSSTTQGTVGWGGIQANGTMGTAVIDFDDFVVYAGTTDSTAPASATSPTTTSITSRQINIGWTAAAGGVDGGGYMVVRGLADPATTPNANGIYALGNTIATGEQVVYIGTAVSFIDGGLNPSTKYYYRIYTVDKAFNYSPALTVNATTTAAPTPAPLPTTQASNITFSSVTQTSFTVNWTSGNGTNRLVVMRAGSAVNSDPQQGNTYAANPAFGSGALLGASNYVVYNGTGTSISVTGLAKATKYYVAVFEFNGNPEFENYLTPAATALQYASPGEIVSAGTSGAGVSWNTASAWVGGVIPTQTDNVTVVAGDSLIVASGQSCFNLTIQAGAKVLNNVVLPTSSLTYLRVYGTSVVVNGTLGGRSITDATKDGALGIEFNNDLTISGSGTVRPARLRPGTGASNVTLTIDANTTLAYSGGTGTGGSGFYTDNSGNDNITIVVNAGKTLSGVENCNFSTTSSTATDGLSNTTFLINGTLSIPGGIFGLRMSTGKSCTVTVNGLLEIGKDLIPTGTTGVTSTITVNSGGELKMTGYTRTAMFDNSLQTVTGAGKFTLGSGVEITVGAAAGLDPANGPIRTTTRSFSTGSSYSFVGTAAQVTGSDVPASVRALTVNNPLGVTLTNNMTIDTALTMKKGALILGAKTLTYNASVTLTYNDTVAQTTTNVEFPAAGGPKKLNINNALGVVLHASRVLDSSLTFTSGKLTTGSNSITVKGLVVSAGAGKFVDGTLALPVATGPSVKKWDVGQSADYLPFTAGLSSVTGTDNISVSALDRNTVAPAAQFSAASKVLRRYYRVAKGAGITAFAADSLVLSYTSADVTEQGVTKDVLKVYQFSNNTWSPVTISRSDTVLNTITVTGVTAFSDFIISGADVQLVTAPMLPVDFESSTVNYAFTNFDGGAATVIANPQSSGINTSANVGKMIKSAGQPWGGTYLTLAAPIDFSKNKTFKAKVFMPKVGAKLLLKVENLTDGGVNFEKEAIGTVANAWEELTFDYSTIDTSKKYQKLVLIFDLGTMGDGSANFTYLFDDINFGAVTEKESNDSIAVANQITLGVEMNGTLSKATGDPDFFWFTTSVRGHFVIDVTDAANTTDADIYLYDSTGKMLYNIDRNSNDRLEYKLPYTGKYYIKVAGYLDAGTYATGPYKLLAGFGPATDANEPNDGPLFGFMNVVTNKTFDNIDTTNTLNPGVGLPGSDYDYFSIIASPGQTITALVQSKSFKSTSTLNNVRLRLYRKGAFATALVTQSTTTGADITASHSVAVADTYYVQVVNTVGTEAGANARYKLTIAKPTGVIKQNEVLPKVFALEQNYPNPFNPSTVIRFSIPQTASTKVVVYDMLGSEVRTLINNEYAAGNYEAVWDGKNNLGQSVSTGVYIYRIQAGTFISTKKMMLLK